MILDKIITINNSKHNKIYYDKHWDANKYKINDYNMRCDILGI